MKKIVLISIAVMFVTAVYYQLFFRYEYKIYEHRVIKVDRLTSKCVWYYPERVDDY